MSSPFYSQLTNQARWLEGVNIQIITALTCLLWRKSYLKVGLRKYIILIVAYRCHYTFQAFEESCKMTDIPAKGQGIYPLFTLFHHLNYCNFLCSPWPYELLASHKDMPDSPQELCLLALFAGLVANRLAQRRFKMGGGGGGWHG